MNKEKITSTQNLNNFISDSCVHSWHSTTSVRARHTEPEQSTPSAGHKYLRDRKKLFLIMQTLKAVDLYLTSHLLPTQY